VICKISEDIKTKSATRVLLRERLKMEKFYDVILMAFFGDVIFTTS